jgi:hypothetical protein
MLRGLALALGVLLSAVQPGRADDPREVLDRAIKAHGGADALVRTQVMARKVTGVMSLLGKELPFTIEAIQQLPGQLRLSSEMTVNNQKIAALRVLNGDKGWQVSGGAVAEMGKEELHDFQEEAYTLWVGTLVPLKDKAFTLAPGPDAPVRGQPAVGVRVTRRGHGEVRLYFDKTSGLLVKVERRAKEGLLDVDKEYIFFDHKSTDGVVLPAKYTEVINSKKVVEVTSTVHRMLNRVEEGTFGKP